MNAFIYNTKSYKKTFLPCTATLHTPNCCPMKPCCLTIDLKHMAILSNGTKASTTYRSTVIKCSKKCKIIAGWLCVIE